MNAPLPPPQPVITVQCDAKPACTGLQFAVTCPAGYYPEPLQQLNVPYAEIDYGRKIRSVLTTWCVKKPETKKIKRAKTH
jgi:hypothetical protein